MRTELVFALPARSGEVSGGNLYNEKLMRALAREHAVTALRVADCIARIQQGKPGLYFIDSLDVEKSASFPAAGAGQYFGLIVHHLASLEPGVETPDLERERTMLSRFHLFLATSPFTAELLRERGYDSTRILTVLPAPPTGGCALPNPTPPFVFSMVCNLIPRKGVSELFEHLALLVHTTDRFHLEVAGRSDIEPKYAEACLEVAQSSTLRSIVRYLGPVPHEQIAECYRRAAAFVSTSKMETFGMALQEARAYGIPILAVDAGHARYQFTAGENGLLFESAAALAHELVALSRKPARMQTLFAGAQRLRASSDYTWTAAAEEFSQQLRRCHPAARGPERNP
jgi:glycosyltransferase involved in cell wall biosynthesis